jgi:hypothetical protein
LECLPFIACISKIISLESLLAMPEYRRPSALIVLPWCFLGLISILITLRAGKCTKGKLAAQ